MLLQGIAKALGLPVAATVFLLILTLVCTVQTIYALATFDFRNELAKNSLYKKADCFSQAVDQVGVCQPVPDEKFKSVFLTENIKKKLRSIFPVKMDGEEEPDDALLFVADSVTKTQLQSAEKVVREVYLAEEGSQVGRKYLLTVASFYMKDRAGNNVQFLAFYDRPQDTKSSWGAFKTLPQTTAMLFSSDMMVQPGCSQTSCANIEDELIPTLPPLFGES